MKHEDDMNNGMKKNKLASGWEVEWCVDVPLIEGTTDADMDRADYRSRDFVTKKEAIVFAKHILLKDVWGAVRVTPFHLEPYEPGCPAHFREYDADSIEISD